MNTNTDDNFDDDYDDLDESNLFTSCPYCEEEYDEIDYEYQICSLCKFNANTINADTCTPISQSEYNNQK